MCPLDGGCLRPVSSSREPLEGSTHFQAQLDDERRVGAPHRADDGGRSRLRVDQVVEAAAARAEVRCVAPVEVAQRLVNVLPGDANARREAQRRKEKGGAAARALHDHESRSAAGAGVLAVVGRTFPLHFLMESMLRKFALIACIV